VATTTNTWQVELYSSLQSLKSSSRDVHVFESKFYIANSVYVREAGR
jgi:hypothetical protein